MPPKKQPCPVCGGTMTFERKADTLSYRDHETTRQTLGWWCDSCDEAIFDGPTLVERERAFLELKAEVDSVLGPAEVAKVRAKLKLSQRQAGELLGGGPRAFQKYESGKQAVSTAMSHLLRLLAKDPDRLKELQRAMKAASVRTSSDNVRGKQQGLMKKPGKSKNDAA